MMAQLGMVGPIEWIFIGFVGLFGLAIKAAFIIFVIVYLVKINNSLETLKKKIDQLEQKHN